MHTPNRNLNAWCRFFKPTVKGKTISVRLRSFSMSVTRVKFMLICIITIKCLLPVSSLSPTFRTTFPIAPRKTHIQLFALFFGFVHAVHCHFPHAQLTMFLFFCLGLLWNEFKSNLYRLGIIEVQSIVYVWCVRCGRFCKLGEGETF